MIHLPILPILIPLFAAALVLTFEHRSFGMMPQRLVAFGSVVALLVVSVLLLASVCDGEILVYLLGNWSAQLGVSLMVDRLSALMVLVGTLLAAACLLHAVSGWDRHARHFHTFFQLQLMGLNGAFLTGDAFNLFVFFEVLLIASYGLLLSGASGQRLRAAFHYLVFNVAASTLFLIALGLLYGQLGSLNLAELSDRVARAAPEDLPLLQATGGLLLVVFCAKAALLPLSLWLPQTYTHAPAAVAALFAIMTKVGLYALLRVSTLVFGASAGALAGFAWSWVLPLGALTLVVAALGVLAATNLRLLAAYMVLSSAATLFIAFGLNQASTVGAGLYYLIHSTFAGAALFLIADMHTHESGEDGPRRAIPARLYLVAAVSLAGLPPLSGFIGKLLLLRAVPGESIAWVWSVVLGSSFLMLLGLMRAGMLAFWQSEPAEPTDPPAESVGTRGQGLQIAAISLLLGYGVAIAVSAAPVLAYVSATATQLLSPAEHLEQVRAAMPTSRSPR